MVPHADVVGFPANEVFCRPPGIGETAPVEPHHPYRDEGMKQLGANDGYAACASASIVLGRTD